MKVINMIFRLKKWNFKCRISKNRVTVHSMRRVKIEPPFINQHTDSLTPKE